MKVHVGQHELSEERWAVAMSMALVLVLAPNFPLRQEPGGRPEVVQGEPPCGGLSPTDRECGPPVSVEGACYFASH